jgi:hypothetical protein
MTSRPKGKTHVGRVKVWVRRIVLLVLHPVVRVLGTLDADLGRADALAGDTRSRVGRRRRRSGYSGAHRGEVLKEGIERFSTEIGDILWICRDAPSAWSSRQNLRPRGSRARTLLCRHRVCVSRRCVERSRESRMVERLTNATARRAEASATRLALVSLGTTQAAAWSLTRRVGRRETGSQPWSRTAAGRVQGTRQF